MELVEQRYSKCKFEQKKRTYVKYGRELGKMTSGLLVLPAIAEMEAATPPLPPASHTPLLPSILMLKTH